MYDTTVGEKSRKDHWDENIMDCSLVISSRKYHHLTSTHAQFFKILPGRQNISARFYFDKTKIDSDTAINSSNQKEHITVVHDSKV
jgi:hypothetical protein